MHSGLVVSGGMLSIFGGFLLLLDFYVPIGASVFGLPLLATGLIMFAVGLYRPEPEAIQAEIGKKFCWYCMTQIDLNSKECSNCSLPQYD